MFYLVYLVFTLFVATDAVRVPLIQKRTKLSKRSTSFSVSKPGQALAHNALLATSVNAADDDTGITMDSVHDLIYMANITVAGVEYTNQLDTGSSDLWIKGSSSPLPNTQQSDITQNLTYGIGWAYGHIAHAPVTFAGISVKSQGFLDVSSASNPVLSYGGNGILGLGFTALSHIDFDLNKTNEATTGRSLLYNIFAENPSEPNFIAFALQRATENGDEVEGSFSIGEYEPEYISVVNTTAIPTWPVTAPRRWNVLLDAVLVGKNKTVIPATTVPNAPSNKAVVLLDSGTSYTYAPTEICDAIYKDIPGARYEASLGQWIVPCSYEVDMALQINGVTYPIHPLDVTPNSLTGSGDCVGSFVPQSISVGAGQFDWLIGDNFLRSVYSIYDFGDFDSTGAMGNPYVKLLSLIDPDEAAIDFTNVRGGTPNQNITFATANAGSASSESTSVTLSTDVAETLDRIGKFFPAMLGVMALNALVLIALVVFGIVYLCKRRGNGGLRRNTTRSARGRLSPMPIPLSQRNSNYGGQPPVQSHSYEPVSMALTEDTLFAAPSPAFHSFEGSTLRPGDRPKSMA